MKKSEKLFTLTALLFVFILFLSQCIHTNTRPDPRGSAFARPQTCRQCHQAIYDSALFTAHFKASAAASAKDILGNFNAGYNSFIYDSSTKVVMEKRDSGLYQVLYKNGRATEAHRFDVSFGITHAQTWLYWQNEHAWELPISYYTAVNNWATSPGFSAVVPNFKRLIGKDCFECHSSGISNKKNTDAAGDYFAPAEITERLEKNSLIFGIDCQRCHGPAAQHVDYQLQHPAIKIAKYIVGNSSLNQQQQLDRCAVCHSGNDKIKLKSRFAFRPGDMLADFFMVSSSGSSNDFDVHGNQYNLLLQSKCFALGKSMNCSSCHNPHNNARQTMATYSKKCMECHKEANDNFCTVTAATSISLKENCIDCHMPKQSSRAINFQLSGSAEISTYLLRNHRIAIYIAEAKKKTKGVKHKM